MDTIRILDQSGTEMARITSSAIPLSFAKKLKNYGPSWDAEFVDDLKLVRGTDASGSVVFVVMISSKYTSEGVA